MEGVACSLGHTISHHWPFCIPKSLISTPTSSGAALRLTQASPPSLSSYRFCNRSSQLSPFQFSSPSSNGKFILCMLSLLFDWAVLLSMLTMSLMGFFTFCCFFMVFLILILERPCNNIFVGYAKTWLKKSKVHL